MLNFALCDDNLNMLTKSSKMLEAIFIRNKLSAQICIGSEDPNQILSYFKKNDCIDVLLIDIDLKTVPNGLELVNLIRKTNKKMYIVFTTAHLEYSLLAYQCKTFDFLPKPITYERLEKTILRIFDDLKESHNNFIKIDDKNTFINEFSVYFIKKDGMKLVLKTQNGDFSLYSSFKEFFPNLSDNFIRCHKSYIVNLNNITNIIAKDNTIIFNNNPNIKCYIGPKYKKDFMEVFKNYGNIKFNMDKPNNRK